MVKAVLSRKLLGLGAQPAGTTTGAGRTLVELHQGQVQGRLSGVKEEEGPVGEGGIRMAARVVEWNREKENLQRRDGLKDVVMWDPERDEMPSPFLARKGRGIIRGL